LIRESARVEAGDFAVLTQQKEKKEKKQPRQNRKAREGQLPRYMGKEVKSSKGTARDEIPRATQREDPHRKEQAVSESRGALKVGTIMLVKNTILGERSQNGRQRGTVSRVRGE